MNRGIMPLDLSKIRTGAQRTLIEPRDIFDARADKSCFPSLRLEQGEVLRKWFERRNEKDLVVKQNTGGGKTLIGLLIAQSSINEGKGPAAYLVRDKFLVEQVVKEAKNLGIRVTTDLKSEEVEFRSSQAILVGTYALLFNGRSRFGIAGNPKESLAVGTFVIDERTRPSRSRWTN